MIDTITSLDAFVVKGKICGNLNALREALLEIVHHLAVNDDNCTVMHKFCPKGSNSFFNYQKAIA